MDALTLARRNSLACLYHNLRCYKRAGNNQACVDLFRDAIEVRYQLIAAGHIQVGDGWRK